MPERSNLFGSHWSNQWLTQNRVRHPPRSGWLDELGRLKGGHLLSLGVALKRAFVSNFRTVRLFHPRFLVRGCSSSNPTVETA